MRKNLLRSFAHIKRFINVISGTITINRKSKKRNKEKRGPEIPTKNNSDMGKAMTKFFEREKGRIIT